MSTMHKCGDCAEPYSDIRDATICCRVITRHALRTSADTIILIDQDDKGAIHQVHIMRDDGKGCPYSWTVSSNLNPHISTKQHRERISPETMDGDAQWKAAQR